MSIRNGGLAARRAVVRWAWRLFRREWRQQVLVLLLLAVAVTAAAVGISLGHHFVPPPQGRFGTAQQMLVYQRSGPVTPEAGVASARDWFGTIEVIGHRHAGMATGTVELRAQDPAGTYSAPMLRLLAGRYPAGPGEVALTDRIAATSRVGVGGRLTLDGRDYAVVGRVENPGDLRGEFILVPPGAPDPPESVTVLTSAGHERFEAFRQSQQGLQAYETPGNGERLAAAAGVFGFLVVSLLLICLIAAGAFAVVAQRRLRQLGMLAAIGATQRYLRLVLLANGAVVGAVGAMLGTAGGLALWTAFASRLETGLGHRIDRFDLPWVQFAGAFLLAVVSATAAAWRPARAAAQVPITQALSQRPPRPQPAHRSVLVALLFFAVGIGCLAYLGSGNPLLTKALEVPELLLLLAGLVAIGAGLLFAGPLAIRILGGVGARLPVASRLALRDLARHQAHAGSALAAVGLAVAIPTWIVILTAAESPDPDGELFVLHQAMTAGGAGLALAILAMTIGLIRAEAAADLRILTAAGATGRIRRTLTATTAGCLALLGSVLGITVAYAALIAVSGGQIGVLARVPLAQLVFIAVGAPALAAAAGWLLAAREPRSLARIRLE